MSQYIDISGTQLQIGLMTFAAYDTVSSLPGSAANGSLAVALDTGALYEYNTNTPGWQLIGPGNLAGDVVGPGSATDKAIAVFDGSTGKLVKNSPITLDLVNGGLIVPANGYIGPSGVTQIAFTSSEIHFYANNGGTSISRLDGNGMVFSLAGAGVYWNSDGSGNIGALGDKRPLGINALSYANIGNAPQNSSHVESFYDGFLGVGSYPGGAVPAVITFMGSESTAGVPAQIGFDYKNVADPDFYAYFQWLDVADPNFVALGDVAWFAGSDTPLPAIFFRASGATDFLFPVSVNGPVASACLSATSTTQGFMPPSMTTTQKNAISSPATGLVVYDNSLNKLSVFTGATWETVTSV